MGKSVEEEMESRAIQKLEATMFCKAMVAFHSSNGEIEFWVMFKKIRDGYLDELSQI